MSCKGMPVYAENFGAFECSLYVRVTIASVPCGSSP